MFLILLLLTPFLMLQFADICKTCLLSLHSKFQFLFAIRFVQKPRTFSSQTAYNVPFKLSLHLLVQNWNFLCVLVVSSICSLLSRVLPDLTLLDNIDSIC